MKNEEVYGPTTIDPVTLDIVHHEDPRYQRLMDETEYTVKVVTNLRETTEYISKDIRAALVDGKIAAVEIAPEQSPAVPYIKFVRITTIMRRDEIRGYQCYLMRGNGPELDHSTIVYPITKDNTQESVLSSLVTDLSETLFSLYPHCRPAKFTIYNGK